MTLIGKIPDGCILPAGLGPDEKRIREMIKAEMGYTYPRAFTLSIGRDLFLDLDARYVPEMKGIYRIRLICIKPGIDYVVRGGYFNGFELLQEDKKFLEQLGFIKISGQKNPPTQQIELDMQRAAGNDEFTQAIELQRILSERRVRRQKPTQE